MTTLPQSLQFSPYFAGLSGKTPEERSMLQDRIDGLPEKARGFMFDPDVPDTLKNLLEQNGVPPQYIVAMAKILFLAALGDVAIGSLEQLIQKLGLEQRQSALVSAGLTMILSDVITERGRSTIGKRATEMPPLTQRIPAIHSVIDSSKTPARNIIDLRKSQ